MGFSWILLINTLLGIGLIFLMVDILERYISKKYGSDIFEEVINSNLNDTEDLGTILGINSKYLIAIIMIVSVILWEIAYPIDIYVMIAKAKDLYEMRKK